MNVQESHEQYQLLETDQEVHRITWTITETGSTRRSEEEEDLDSETTTADVVIMAGAIEIIIIIDAVDMTILIVLTKTVEVMVAIIGNNLALVDVEAIEALEGE